VGEPDARRAPRSWESFPLLTSPRPVILLAPRVRHGGAVDGASKIAWMQGAIDCDVALPAGVLELIGGHSRGQEADTRLRVTAVEHTTAEFLCDRGPRQLPAYRLEVTGLQGSCVVLDPQVECWWPHGDKARSLFNRHATIEADGRTIHFPAFGGVLTQFHHAEFEEHHAYVVGHAVTAERQVPDGTGITLVGRKRQVFGLLDSPLGGRVLIDRDRQPLAVTPEPPTAGELAGPTQ
jgi:hypothetical protein